MAKKNIETMLLQLEDITHKIDAGDISINELLETYQKSTKLVRECRDEVAKIENMIMEYDV